MSNFWASKQVGAERKKKNDVPAAAPAPALQRTPLGLGPCVSATMAEFSTTTCIEGGLLGEYYERVLSGEANYSSEPESHGQRAINCVSEGNEVVNLAVVAVVDLSRSVPGPGLE